MGVQIRIAVTLRFRVESDHPTGSFFFPCWEFQSSFYLLMRAAKSIEDARQICDIYIYRYV